jgi:purine-nucleoside phosphorylase
LNNQHRTQKLTTDDAIINPHKPPQSPGIGPVAVMAATREDLYYLCERLSLAQDDFQRLFMSRLYSDKHSPEGYSVSGPFVGAPYAVMLLENLIARGARQIIFIGWCGAVAHRVKIGDLILPTAGYIAEGTSRHYGAGDHYQLPATLPLVSRFRRLLDNGHCVFHEGAIWTTDAVYRETRREVATHQQNGILAVEMEFSALYSAARFRGVDLVGILVVSDELSDLEWRPGFRQKRFMQGRKTACRLIAELIDGL